jgi:hypothetical protein
MFVNESIEGFYDYSCAKRSPEPLHSAKLDWLARNLRLAYFQATATIAGVW